MLIVMQMVESRMYRYIQDMVALLGARAVMHHVETVERMQEYNNLPLRFSRQLSLDQMNDAVAFINAAVLQKGALGWTVNPHLEKHPCALLKLMRPCKQGCLLLGDGGYYVIYNMNV